MIARTPELFTLLKEVVPVRPSGQPQSPESVEREKGFAERSAQLEKLRALRLQHAPPVATAPRGRKRAAK